MEPTINQMPMPEPKNKTWLWVMLVIIVGLLAGGGVYAWQSVEAKKLITANEEKIRTEMQSKINETENKVTELTSKLSKIETNLAELEKNQPANSLCTAAPTPNAMGSDNYPLDSKYQNLRYLGELFTASDCNDPERLSKIFGVSGDNYTLGSNLSLKNNPSPNLLSTLKSIGFKCKQNVSETTCKQWELKSTIKLDQILRLKQFYQELNGSDCINCG